MPRTRREFLAHVLAGAPSAALVLRANSARSAPPSRLIHLLAVFDPGTDPVSAGTGLRFGTEEAGRTAMLLGSELKVLVSNRRPAAPEPDAAAAPTMAAAAWDAVVAGAEAAFDNAPGGWPAAPRICFGPSAAVGPVAAGTTGGPRVLHVRADDAQRLEAAVSAATRRHGTKAWLLLLDGSVPAPWRARVADAMAKSGATITGARVLADPREAADLPATADAVAAVGRDGFVLAVRAGLPARAGTPRWFTGTLADPPDDVGAAPLRELYAVEWSPRLVRFGAAELNDRFQQQFRREITPSAWAAWFAVRVATDAVLRSRATGSRLLEQLTAGRFDGHKGVPLTFDPETGRLRQPLHVIARTESSPRFAVWE